MLSKQQRLDIFQSLFRGRADVFARRWQKWDDGISGYSPVYKDWKKKGEYESLTTAHIESHLIGRTIVGIYPLLKDNTSYFIAVDFDGENWIPDVKRLLSVCRKNKLPVYVEQSRSGKGAHIWCFFEKAYPSYKSRKIFLSFLRQTKQIGDFDKDDSFDRLFPSQDYLSGKGLGNLIALPLQGQSRKHNNTTFLDCENNFRPYKDQWEFLSTVQNVSADKLDALYEAVAENAEIKIRRSPRTNANTIQITLQESIIISKSDITPKLANYLREELNFFNADYIIKQQMGVAAYNIEKYFKTIDAKDGTVYIPRGFLYNLKSFLKEENIKFDIKDKRTKKDTVVFSPTFKLLNYQKEAVKQLLKTKSGGVLVAPPGAGKTVMGLALIIGNKQPALILTHRKQIYNQWLDSIESFLGIPKKEIGQYTSTKKKAQYVTVAMVQTLSRLSNINELRNKFGTVIVDECHHMPARMFRDVVSKFNPYYLYGMTATPKRKNNDEKLIYAYLGDVAYEIPVNYKKDDSGDYKNGKENAIDIVIKETSLSLPFKPKITDFNTMARIISHDSVRNSQIVKDVEQEIKKNNRCIILTERKDHAEILHYYLKRNFETILFTGDLTPKKREVVEKQIKDKNFQVLIATGHILGEGSDIQGLDCLFLVFPFAFEGKLIQYIGRIERGDDNTKKVYDYHDCQIEILDKMFKKRKRYYNKMAKSNV